MRWRIRATKLGMIAVPMAWLAAACAGSSDPGPEGAGGGGANGTASSAGTGAGTATSGTSAAGGGSACSEQPCKVTSPQCGCSSGDKCTISGPSLTRTCAPDGTKSLGEVCDGDCKAGALCLALGTTADATESCKKFCDSDADCTAPGGRCLLEVFDEEMNPVPEKFCTENCDPISNAGCELGLACDVGLDDDQGYSVCRHAGLGSQGDPCTQFDDCAPTFNCIAIGTSSKQCLRYCDVEAPDCPGTEPQCVSFQPPIVIDGTEFGACYEP